ncbi:hypothetical protein OSB04_028171 [Centaurea solstitialis]|uniref:Uncharacterized protein n=1 Tax=Centaurea solstitialis TaxID=347529 RepID=A0AA38SF73_9ASTR|nr:hypothetical protein OSB04_028171 [Centaurea solstitialis]
MLRMRLVWFSLGLGSTAAIMSHFVYKDLLLDRHSLSCQLKQQFDSLESRVSNLESVLPKVFYFSFHLLYSTSTSTSTSTQINLYKPTSIS